MPIQSKRLLMYFQEILRNGATSSWYLAKKFGFTKRRLEKDLCNARKRQLVVYKSCRLSSLKVNFTMTEKGLKYMAKKGVAL